MTPPLYLALVHHPVLDSSGQVVATNITNFDIHDIARAARVYGVERYFIVHPMREQLMFVSRVLDHCVCNITNIRKDKKRCRPAKVAPFSDREEANSAKIRRLSLLSTCYLEKVGHYSPDNNIYCLIIVSLINSILTH